MIFYGLMFVILILSMIVQIFVPYISFQAGMTFEARILVPWVVFYVIALAAPYPVMIAFACVAGFLLDALHQVPVGDFAFGTTILLFALFGSLVHGVRPLFRRGHWIAPVLMVGIAVLFQLICEYLLISFQRGQLSFSGAIWLKMMMTSLAAMLLAPLLLVMISRIARKCGYQLEMEQFTFRRRYGYPV